MSLYPYTLNDKNLRLTSEQKCDIAFDILDAVHFLHENKIIHRDIKPDNILVTSSLQAVICDFTLARMCLTNDEQEKHYTGDIGSRNYTSPEILNNLPYSFSTDIYSVGITLIELFGKHLTPYYDSLFRLLAHRDASKRPTAYHALHFDIFSGYQFIDLVLPITMCHDKEMIIKHYIDKGNVSREMATHVYQKLYEVNFYSYNSDHLEEIKLVKNMNYQLYVQSPGLT